MSDITLRIGNVDTTPVARIRDAIIPDEAAKMYICTTAARFMEPYVPMQTGTLSQSPLIDTEGVTYDTPYAHYQYVGEVYGPNIPIMQGGAIVGWWSPPGQKKHPTGRAINYSASYHPKAGPLWDERMMAEKADEFADDIKRYLIFRAGGTP